MGEDCSLKKSPVLVVAISRYFTATSYCSLVIELVKYSYVRYFGLQAPFVPELFLEPLDIAFHKIHLGI